jgi:hypothetical protein
MQRRTGYDDVDEISDPDGVVALISRRRSTGSFSVAVFRVYERDGVKEKTAFLGLKQLPALRRVLDIAEKRIEKLEADTRPGAR